MEALFLIFGLIQLTSAFLSENNKAYQNVSVVPFDAYFTRRAGRRLETSDNIIENLISKTLWLSLKSEENPKCQFHSDIIYNRANELDVWALKIIDASAKLPSGILNGNLNQFGDFDQCLSSFNQYNDEIIQGKYCLANIDIRIDRNVTNEKFHYLDDLIHGGRIFTNELLDPGHRIPKFETFSWGICMPSSCSHSDLQKALNKEFGKISSNAINFKAAVDDDLCYISNSKKFGLVNYLALFFFATIITFSIWGTMISGDSKWKKCIRCFSLKENLTYLLKTEAGKDDLSILHGARFINAIALLLTHKQMALLFNPFMNRTDMSTFVSKPWSMIARSAIIYTDTFIMMSGVLASYTMIKEYDQKKRVNFKDKVFSRFLRFTPNLLALIVFCTYIMEYLGSGPQWGLVVDRYANLCKANMWRNFLYVHNYFGFENMCLTHTHQLGIDMQLYLISPFLTYFLWKQPKRTMVLMFIMGAASTWLRYSVTIEKEISTLVYYGISVDRLWKTANLSYILPTHRLTVYLIGIALGFFLRRGLNQIKLSFLQASIGWTIAIAAAILAMFGPYHVSSRDYVYNPNEAAIYNAVSPILWSVFLLWCAIACMNGRGGWFNRFLSWKYFIVFTKISYALYLTQFPIFFFNVGIQRSVQYYRGLSSVVDLVEFGIIFAASVVLTLLFDIPFDKLKKELTSEKAQVPVTESFKEVQNCTETVLPKTENVDTIEPGWRRRIVNRG